MLEVSYHEWKSLVKCKGTEASVVWVRDAQACAEGNRKVRHDDKLHALPESTSEKPTSGHANMARFSEAVRLYWN